MQKSTQIKSKKKTKTNHQGLSKKKRLVILYIKKPM
jgi:hypothetical protein